MNRSLFVGSRPAALAAAAWAHAQQPDPGVPVPPLGAGPYVFDTAEQHKIRVVVVTRGLSHPWSLAFLPDGAMLIAERPGQLRLVRNGKLDPTPVAGVPAVRTDGNGGLMDVALHPRFAENHLVYFTYTKPVENGKGTPALARGRLDGSKLSDVKDLVVPDAYEGNGGLNGRVVFGRDGMVYFSTGGNVGKVAQDPASLRGKILRLRDDGSVPPDNPFASRAGFRPEIYTLGHRNTLGLIVHPQTGVIWNNENGPNGGDEVNIILPGRNYGWPLVSFGREYSGARISGSPTGEGFESPLLAWLPQIAIAGMAVYTGDKFPAWKGNVFVGSLRTGGIAATGHIERIVFNEKTEETAPRVDADRVAAACPRGAPGTGRLSLRVDGRDRHRADEGRAPANRAGGSIVHGIVQGPRTKIDRRSSPEDGLQMRQAMKLTVIIFCVLSTLSAVAPAHAGQAAGQAQASPPPATDTIAPDIPGVVAGGTKVTVIKEGFQGTEGPIALPDGSVVFAETNASRITRIDKDNNVSTFLENTNGSNGLAFDSHGRLISVQTTPGRTGVGVIYPKGSEATLANNFEGRPNDLTVNKKGGAYFTVPAAIAQPGGAPPATPFVPAVYYIAPGGTAVRVADGIELPNGILLSRDERTLYINNTRGEYLLAFDVQPDGQLRNRRNFAKYEGVTRTDAGVVSGADGLAVDDGGRLYAATAVGVQVFSTQGRHLGTIPVSRSPQNLAFAGPDKKTLYIVGRGAAYKVQMLAQGFLGRAK